MFNLDSDEEDDAEEDYEAKWRQQRFEREKFLQEQEASCNYFMSLHDSKRAIDLNTFGFLFSV